MYEWEIGGRANQAASNSPAARSEIVIEKILEGIRLDTVPEGADYAGRELHKGRASIHPLSTGFEPELIDDIRRLVRRPPRT
ncbi:hypothetical protein Rhsp01_43130 [Rhizobium sp. NBRC 114257]|uniref:Uncharacterized protein n=1 Tax=Rhizobium dioscoreae TaxID=2653122 RepID=A0ABQ0ZA90_9HYPH|nr:hypothetical protein RsS93_47580 [Rhizobium dioscoreae]GLU83137.1 hypothetical protein Rhsp01_43130 [Rhizobium sp. NBRC 114257]